MRKQNNYKYKIRDAKDSHGWPGCRFVFVVIDIIKRLRT